MNKIIKKLFAFVFLMMIVGYQFSPALVKILKADNPSAPSEVQIAFNGNPGGVVEGNTVTYNVSGTDVSFSILGITPDGEGKLVYAPGEEANYTFTLSDSFDPDTMEVIHTSSSNNQETPLVVSNTNVFTLSGMGSGVITIRPKGPSAGQDIVATFAGASKVDNEEAVEITTHLEDYEDMGATDLVTKITVTGATLVVNNNSISVSVPRNGLNNVLFALSGDWDPAYLEVYGTTTDPQHVQILTDENSTSFVLVGQLADNTTIGIREAMPTIPETHSDKNFSLVGQGTGSGSICYQVGTGTKKCVSSAPGNNGILFEENYESDTVVTVSAEASEDNIINAVHAVVSGNELDGYNPVSIVGGIAYTVDASKNFELFVQFDEDQPGQNNQEPQNDKEDISIDLTFNNTRGELVFFNDGSTRTPEGTSYKGTITKAGYTASDKENEITITTAFGDPIANKITINNVDYNFTDGAESHTIKVAGASSYTIVVYGDSSIVTPKTIIWVNPDYVPKDEEDANWVKDFTIGHGYAKAIAVYNEKGQLLPYADYINNIVQPDGSKSDQYGINNGFGWISVYPGYKIVFEFVPEYGYQLTQISINEQPMAASSTINRFEIVMPESDGQSSGNIHFGATFTKTEDVVKANSAKISSGEIELNNTLEGGSAQLTVNDVTLSSDKIAGFEKAAGEYSVSEYLDIDLYNVYYKGKKDDTDVWSKKISELSKDAVISIKLEEGIDAEDIVIVHNIHDGEEYEIIEIDSYDPKTRIITFKTNSFSNFAIATKTKTVEVLPEESNSANDKAGASALSTIITDGMNGKLSDEVLDELDPTLQAALENAIDNNKEITVDLSTDSIKEGEIDKKDLEKINTKIGKDDKLLGYFDIDLNVLVDGQEVGKLTRLEKPITIKVDAKDLVKDLPKTSDGYTRTYVAIRLHNGEVDVIPAKLNADGTIEFETDRFSTYTITYVDIKNPKTGDSILYFALLLTVSVLGLIGSLLYKRVTVKVRNK